MNHIRTMWPWIEVKWATHNREVSRNTIKDNKSANKISTFDTSITKSTWLIEYMTSQMKKKSIRPACLWWWTDMIKGQWPKIMLIRAIIWWSRIMGVDSCWQRDITTNFINSSFQEITQWTLFSKALVRYHIKNKTLMNPLIWLRINMNNKVCVASHDQCQNEIYMSR